MSFLSAIGGGGVDASGGTTVTTFTDNTGTEYRVHAFENVGSDTFTVNSGGEVDVLVVGGGGGGGSGQTVCSSNFYNGGGGGAGGLINQTLSVDAQSFAITVGAGGNGAINNTDNFGEKGDNTTAFGLTALGGGGGETRRAQSLCNADPVNMDGGSGGGRGDAPGRAGFALQPTSADGGLGNPGGIGEEFEDGGGGGGAMAAGQDASGGVAGDGGIGFDASNTFSTQFGDNGFFAGGGGGGVRFSDAGAGGLGGGGDGANNNGNSGTPGEDALANTGGGGGGAGADSSSGGNANGGAGGSGIVLIRYEI